MCPSPETPVVRLICLAFLRRVMITFFFAFVVATAAAAAELRCGLPLETDVFPNIPANIPANISQGNANGAKQQVDGERERA